MTNSTRDRAESLADAEFHRCTGSEVDHPREEGIGVVVQDFPHPGVIPCLRAMHLDAMVSQDHQLPRRKTVMHHRVPRIRPFVRHACIFVTGVPLLDEPVVHVPIVVGNPAQQPTGVRTCMIDTCDCQRDLRPWHQSCSHLVLQTVAFCPLCSSFAWAEPLSFQRRNGFRSIDPHQPDRVCAVLIGGQSFGVVQAYLIWGKPNSNRVSVNRALVIDLRPESPQALSTRLHRRRRLLPALPPPQPVVILRRQGIIEVRSRVHERILQRPEDIAVNPVQVRHRSVAHGIQPVRCNLRPPSDAGIRLEPATQTCLRAGDVILDCVPDLSCQTSHAPVTGAVRALRPMHQAELEPDRHIPSERSRIHARRSQVITSAGHSAEKVLAEGLIPYGTRSSTDQPTRRRRVTKQLVPSGPDYSFTFIIRNRLGSVRVFVVVICRQQRNIVREVRNRLPPQHCVQYPRYLIVVTGHAQPLSLHGT